MVLIKLWKIRGFFFSKKSAKKGTDQKARKYLAESLQACNRPMHTVDQRESE
jgi:hypothetical protein